MSLREERTLSSEQVFEGRAVKLRVDRVEKPGGRQTTREIVEHSDAVAIIALEGDDVLLVRQFRKAVGQTLLEVPAGGIEPGEEADQCVHRELQEETGYFPQKVERLGGFYAAPGYCTEYLHLYLATELTLAPLQAEDTEDIDLLRFPLAQIPHLIASGEVCDAKSIAALLILLRRYQG